MDGKLKNLSNKQMVRPNTTNSFYPLVSIETDIIVSIDELSVLKKT
jgi:hypothetical protein